MNPGSVCEILNRFFFYGLAEGYFYAAQRHNVSSIGNTHKIRPENTIGMLTNGGITPKEYLQLLDNSSYSIVFRDGSILYIECTFEKNTMQSYRFFYIPSPFEERHLLDLPDAVPLSDWLRVVLDDQGVSCLKSVGALRFDCVRDLPADNSDPHPVSHMTMMTGDCRIPIKGPLQITTFLHFIFDYFQRSIRPFWLNFSSYLNLDASEVTIRPAEMESIHISWETA